MDANGRHVGFRHQEAPEAVYWSDLSWLVPVDPLDRRSCRGVHVVMTLSFLSFFGLALISGLGGYWIANILALPHSLFMSLAGVFLLSGFIISFTNFYVTKWMLIRRLRSRSGLLFEPGWKSVFVGIEDVFTFDKQKLTADDFGLLCLRPGLVQLEMTSHRAQFLAEEVTVSLVHANKNSVAVRLSSKSQPHLWSVALTPAAMGRNPFGEARGQRKAERLLAMFHEAGVLAAAPSAAVPEAAVVSTMPESEAAVLAALPVEDEGVEGEVFENADLLESRYQTILEAIRSKEKKRNTPLKSLFILAVSLLVFFQLGFVKWGFEYVAILLVVLLVHEGGHYLGMKIFGYRNIQMFFIPLAGAAVSGAGHNVAAWKKAMVTLMGPLPGIGIGLVLGLICLISSTMTLMPYATLFLVLNLLNLLPIFPLDGGRFLQEVVFSRSRVLELVMNILATAALLIAGFAMNDWILRILGFVNLFTLGYKFKLAAAAQKMRDDLLQKNQMIPETADGEVPETILKQIIHWIHRNTPGVLKPNAVATMALDLWDRIRIRPPKVAATVGLLILFLSGYVVAAAAVLVLEFAQWRGGQFNSEIVSSTDTNGKVCYVEKTYAGGKLFSEAELTEDQQYYHGSYIQYDGDKPVQEGFWDNGRKVGTWTYRNSDGQVVEEFVYEDGKPVLIRTLNDDGQWEESSWESMEDFLKEIYTEQAKVPQGPGDESDGLVKEAVEEEER